AYPRISREASRGPTPVSGTFRPRPKCGQALEFAIPGKPRDLRFGGELVAPGLVGVGVGLLQQELRDSQTGGHAQGGLARVDQLERGDATEVGVKVGCGRREDAE